MDINEAKEILNECTREELRDHAFGDTEVFWSKDRETEIGGGYFSGSNANVWVGENSFNGADAIILRDCGTLGTVERNDETGPDTYNEGEVIPGLSKGDVFHELTGQYQDNS